MKPNKSLTLTQFFQEYQPFAQKWFFQNGISSLNEINILLNNILEELTQILSANVLYPFETLQEKFISIANKKLSQTQRMKDKNFGLSEITFNELLTQVQAGEETMFKEVFFSHFKDCIHYLQRNCKASYDDAYDATMNALLLFHKKMKADKISYGNLRFLFTKMAKDNYLKWLAKKDQKTVDISSLNMFEEDIYQLDTEAQFALKKAWQKLCDNCQHLLKSHFYGGQSMVSIAAQIDKAPGTLRKQKQRCMEKLRTSFFKYYIV